MNVAVREDGTSVSVSCQDDSSLDRQLLLHCVCVCVLCVCMSVCVNVAVRRDKEATSKVKFQKQNLHRKVRMIGTCTVVMTPFSTTICNCTLEGKSI